MARAHAASYRQCRSPRWRAVVAAAPAAAAVCGCEPLVGAEFDGYRPYEPTSCSHAGPPLPPALAAPVGGDTEIIVAVRNLDFGETLDGAGQPLHRQLGYDLDGLCTGQGDGASCVEPPWAKADHTDGVAGRDNALGAFVQALPEVLGFTIITSELTTEGIEDGTFSPPGLIRIRGYGGFGDDDQVEVAWFTTEHLPPMAGERDGGIGAPSWDGSDVWPIQSTCLEPAGDGGPGSVESPRFVDAAAYVENYVLVARLAAMDMMFFNVRLGIKHAVLTGKLVRDAAQLTWGLSDAVIAGRLAVRDMLGAGASIGKTVAGAPLCTDNPNYPAIRDAFCTVVDIGQAASAPPNTECDAISFGLGFHAVPAGLGSVVAPEDTGPVCVPGTDPSNDDCAP